MSASAATSNATCTIPETTTADFCAPPRSSHRLFATDRSFHHAFRSIYHQHGRPADAATAQRVERLICLLKRERRDLGAHWNLRGEREKLLPIPARQVRHGLQGTLAL